MFVAPEFPACHAQLSTRDQADASPEFGQRPRLLRPHPAATTAASAAIMPFPVTQREKYLLAVIALLIVLGLLGFAVL